MVLFVVLVFALTFFWGLVVYVVSDHMSVSEYVSFYVNHVKIFFYDRKREVLRVWKKVSKPLPRPEANLP